MALICLSQINSDAEFFGFFFHILICHLDIFFGKVSVQDFWLSFLFLWRVGVFLFLIDFGYCFILDIKIERNPLNQIRKHQIYH